MSALYDDEDNDQGTDILGSFSAEDEHTLSEEEDALSSLNELSDGQLEEEFNKRYGNNEDEDDYEDYSYLDDPMEVDEEDIAIQAAIEESLMNTRGAKPSGVK